MIHDSPAINTRLGATAIELPILQYRRLSWPTRGLQTEPQEREAWHRVILDVARDEGGVRDNRRRCYQGVVDVERTALTSRVVAKDSCEQSRLSRDVPVLEIGNPLLPSPSLGNRHSGKRTQPPIPQKLQGRRQWRPMP